MGFIRTVLDEGYLKLNIDPTSAGAKIINTSIRIAALLLQCAIEVIAIIKMRRHRHINMTFNVCFMLCLLFACANNVSSLSLLFTFEYWDVEVIRNDVGLSTVFFINFMSIGCFFLSILAIFVLKLYLTFKESVYRMSSLMMIVFGVIICVMFICILVISSFFFWVPFSVWFWAHNTLFILCTTLYVIGCVLAVSFFISNLSKLAKARRISLYKSSVRKEDIKLNPQQQQLSDIAAKYVMLFSIEIGSSLFSMMLVLAVNVTSGLRVTMFTIDVFINLFCIYLQFAFAGNHYRKCCGYCDRRFRGAIAMRTRTAIYKHTLESMDMKSDEGGASTTGALSV